MPQFDGLFDYQNNVRPSYFAFKLLSRLAGERLRLASSDAAVHGFMTHDDKLQTYNLLLWNFSESPAEVVLSLENLPKNMKVRHLVLDALAPSADENARLRLERLAELKKGTQQLRVHFDPYAVRFWSLE